MDLSPMSDVTIPGTSFHVSWVVLVIAIVVGLLLIRTAFTLVKVLVVVAIGVALWLLFEYVLNHVF